MSHRTTRVIVFSINNIKTIMNLISVSVVSLSRNEILLLIQNCNTQVEILSQPYVINYSLM